MNVQMIVNPNAGPKSTEKKLIEIEKYFKNKGFEIRRINTTKQGDAKIFAQEAAKKNTDIVIAVGGDGTINEVINGLAGSKTLLGVIPVGTANVFATEIGIPTQSTIRENFIIKAAEIIATGKNTKIDLGKVVFKDNSSRYFLMWCGIGLDAKITAEKKSPNKSMLKPLINYVSWIMSGLKIIYKHSGTDVKIITDNNIYNEHIVMALVSNGRLYGKFFKFTPNAKLNDGLFDLAILKGDSWKDIAKHTFNLILNRHINDSNFIITKTKKVNFTSLDELPVHVDAETIGNTPIEVEIVPNALNVIIPNNSITENV